MDTKTLLSICGGHGILKSVVKNVCPADYLPASISSRPSFYIVNTDNSDGKGRHWVAFYFPPKGPPEFFDSLGRRPDFYHDRFRAILICNDGGYMYNECRLQAPNTVSCGGYCIYYVHLRSQGYSMHDIVSSMNSLDYWANEKLIKCHISGM
jgi:hypothetical protein